MLELKAELKATHTPLQDLIIAHRLLSEEDLTRLYAKELNLPFVRLSVSELSPEYLRLLPEHMARRYKAVVFDVQPGDTKLVATDNPNDVAVNDLLRKILGENYKLFMATPSHLHSALDAYRRHNITHPESLVKDLHQTSIKSQEDPRIFQTVHFLIEQAVSRHATAIHIEPRENIVVVRFRISGSLSEAYKLPRNVLEPIVSRLKLLSGSNLSQAVSLEGRFRIESHESIYTISMTTLPVIDGEKVVLRLHNESASAPSLEHWVSGEIILRL